MYQSHCSYFVQQGHRVPVLLDKINNSGRICSSVTIWMFSPPKKRCCQGRVDSAQEDTTVILNKERF